VDFIVKLDGIDIEETLSSAEEALKNDESISVSLKPIFLLLITIVKILLNQKGLNSSNSSKPPSKDENKPDNKNGKRKSKSENSRGGQKGSKGTTLTKVENPDVVKSILVDRSKIPEGNYKKIDTLKRQVVDIEINRVITEYQVEVLINIETGEKYTAEFPEKVTKAIQYGDKLKSHVVYMSQYQLLPYDRVREFFTGQMGIPISSGSIYNFNNVAYEALATFEECSKQALRNSTIAHVDETGVNISGVRHWLHVTSNNSWTFYYPHKKRGTEAMNEIDILPHFKGVLCHDHWKPYYFYDNCDHALCNAHHMRELTRAWEQDKQAWAKEMLDFLVDTNGKVKEFDNWDDKTQANKYRKIYRQILKKGNIECPAPTEADRVHPKGRVKRSKARNLLERLNNFEDDVLRFMEMEEVPFTNNLGERDIRMTKVHQKISGCFQSELGAKMFCRIRGYLSSCRKQGVNSSDAMALLFKGELPDFAKNLD
jgi:transposase